MLVCVFVCLVLRQKPIRHILCNIHFAILWRRLCVCERERAVADADACMDDVFACMDARVCVLVWVSVCLVRCLHILYECTTYWGRTSLFRVTVAYTLLWHSFWALLYAPPTFLYIYKTMCVCLRSFFSFLSLRFLFFVFSSLSLPSLSFILLHFYTNLNWRRWRR